MTDQQRQAIAREEIAKVLNSCDSDVREEVYRLVRSWAGRRGQLFRPDIAALSDHIADTLFPDPAGADSEANNE